MAAADSWGPSLRSMPPTGSRESQAGTWSLVLLQPAREPHPEERLPIVACGGRRTFDVKLATWLYHLLHFQRTEDLLRTRLKNQLACLKEPVNDALNRLGKRLGDLLSCGLKNDWDVISRTSQSSIA